MGEVVCAECGGAFDLNDVPSRLFKGASGYTEPKCWKHGGWLPNELVVDGSRNIARLGFQPNMADCGTAGELLVVFKSSLGTLYRFPGANLEAWQEYRDHVLGGGSAGRGLHVMTGTSSTKFTKESL